MDILINKKDANNDSTMYYSFDGVNSEGDRDLVRDLLGVKRTTNHILECGTVLSELPRRSSIDIDTDTTEKVKLAYADSPSSTSNDRSPVATDCLGNKIYKDSILVLHTCSNQGEEFIQYLPIDDKGDVTTHCTECSQDDVLHVEDLAKFKYECECGNAGVGYKSEDAYKVKCNKCGTFHYLVLDTELNAYRGISRE